MQLSLLFIAGLTLLAITEAFWITIPQGYAGVLLRYREMIEPVLKPGLHFYNPFTTSVELVETRPQTDVVHNVACGTNDGVHLNIRKIEVGNQLPFDSVFNTTSRFGLKYDEYLVMDLVIHQISVICSKQSAHEIAISRFDEIDDLLSDFLNAENKRQGTGLVLSFVRPSRPELPSSLNKYYLEIAEEKTRKKVLEEKKERIKIEKENEQMIAIKDNEILMQTQQQQQERAKISNEMLIENARALAESEKLKAESLKQFYAIPGYSQVEVAKHMANNSKIYYGEKLPTNYPLLSLK
jgi:regulator of protease activity HflC (stomatin/prohibitin superfamily)